MKKAIRKLLSAAAVITLSACSADAKPEDTAEAFWRSMESGDLEKAQTYVSEEAEEMILNLASAADTLTQSAQNYELSEETLEKIKNYTASTMKITYGGHSVKDAVKISDTEYQVSVNVKVADPLSLETAMSQLDYESYVNEYQAEIMKMMNEEGMEKAYGRLFDLIFTYLNENLSSITGSLTYNDNEIIMKLKQNEDGKWLITSVQGAENTSE